MCFSLSRLAKKSNYWTALRASLAIYVHLDIKTWKMDPVQSTLVYAVPLRPSTTTPDHANAARVEQEAA